MPRPKGSKNKATIKKAAAANKDFEAMIAEKVSAKESLAEEIASIEENIAALKADLKEKKAGLKAIDKEIVKLEAQKAAFDIKQAEEAKQAELDELLKKLMSDGMSAGDILEKLK